MTQFNNFDDAQANAYLDARGGRKGYLTTIGRIGYPHTVPLTYFRVGHTSTSPAAAARSASRTSHATHTCRSSSRTATPWIAFAAC